ncbi:MAG: integrase [Phyllobacteriaceae bacterium]|nr:integrase [Phyllobacteriaceae bacterium]
MTTWLTAGEIAAMRLPGLPSTERGVIKHAASQGWDAAEDLWRARSGRGGGREYHMSLLPGLAQAALRARSIAVATVSADDDGTLSRRAQIARDARLAVASAYARFASGMSAPEASLMAVFVDTYNAGQTDCDEWIRAELPKISTASLRRWRTLARSGDAAALAVDRGASRAGTGVLDTANDGAVKRFILGLIAVQPHLSAAAVRKQVRAEFGDRITTRGGETAMPPVRTFQHFLRKEKAEHHVALTRLTNPDLYRSTMAPSGRGALSHIKEPNQLWQIDASPVDALCTDGRHSIYACVDIATRRVMLSVSRTPRASAVMLLIRKAALAWGLPERIKTDNGSDFKARDTRRLFDALGVEVELSDAYSPQQKGHVERAIRTFQHEVGPLLPGFTGHSVADRKAIEARKSFAQRLGESDAETFGVALSGPELAARIDEWAAVSYANKPHSGLDGMTPAAAALAAQHKPRMVEPRALDVLLMPVAGKDGIRTVTKFGVRIDGRHYMTPGLLPGTQTLIRMDPADMGRAYCFAPDGGAYLGEAICPELSGVDPQAFVSAAKAAHRELVDSATRDIKAEMKRIAKGPALIDRALEVDRRDAPNVTPFPRRTETHETAQTRAAADAADMMMPARPAEDEASPAVLAEQRRLIAEIEQTSERVLAKHAAEEAARRNERLGVREGSNVTALPETPLERYRRCLEIKAKVDAGEQVDSKSAVWCGVYMNSAEYKGQASLHEEYGDLYVNR